MRHEKGRWIVKFGPRDEAGLVTVLKGDVYRKYMTDAIDEGNEDAEEEGRKAGDANAIMI